VGWLSRDDIATRKGHAGPMGVETPQAQMPGKHTFAYAIIPGGADWREAVQLSREFNAPLRMIEASLHPGILKTSQSMVENLNLDFALTAIKLAQDGKSLIVRGYNTQPSSIEVSIKLWRAFKCAQVVNLDEANARDLPITPEGMVYFHVEGHKIITFRFSD